METGVWNRVNTPETTWRRGTGTKYLMGTNPRNLEERQNPGIPEERQNPGIGGGQHRVQSLVRKDINRRKEWTEMMCNIEEVYSLWKKDFRELGQM